MALNSPQKYYKASLKRNLNNRIVKKKIKTSTNKLLNAIQNKQSSDEINILFQEAQSFIDKSVTKGVHKKIKHLV